MWFGFYVIQWPQRPENDHLGIHHNAFVRFIGNNSNSAVTFIVHEHFRYSFQFMMGNDFVESMTGDNIPSDVSPVFHFHPSATCILYISIDIEDDIPWTNDRLYRKP